MAVVALRARRVRSPDGRLWEVRSGRLRLPPWRQPDHDPLEDAEHPLDVAIAFLAAVFLGLVVPLLTFVAELPVAVARSLVSRTRWVEAVCPWPAYIRVTWKATAKNARAARDHVVEHLARGYENVDPPNAERIEMTKPPGI